MLDSSPIPISPPKKLKRTASVASLPSPPPSVEHPKKRTTVQRFSSDTESGSEDNEEDELRHTVVCRKLLFPPSASTISSGENVDDLDDTSQSDSKSTDGYENSHPDATKCPSAHSVVAPVSPPPSRRRAAKRSPLQQTPSPSEKHELCSASELPVVDEENNPFLASSRPKLRRPRSPHEVAERPTMTYVFKGIKTSIPNPYYNMPDSVYERARLPLSHADYSPLPPCPPRRLFPEAYPEADDVGEDEDTFRESDSVDVGLQTAGSQPPLSSLFVDDLGNPLPDSGPQGVRGSTMDARDIGRMAVGPIRGRG